MKITIWEGCKVISELVVPDIGIDPWNNLIGTSMDVIHEVPIPYHAGIKQYYPVGP